ncbi:hypothetical protein ACR8AL_09375 [Clavibacter sepedonicus]|uniref:Integral membrane protein n=1 Tax=Clavibacter sepedonicus TaxID=31964 RepID=B0RJ07_CLASE|nr:MULTISPECIES: hypothetical protein [Clavibacter]OQJ45047.1 hypothetical protein B5P19_15760 [Clavibacter sepedonicus]OQJ45098.1 hypothetical protein B5P19_16060 [Clavibacter sepedonicus]OQJ51000.1 hypothetical protein B5P20_15990 [Clavibacter sepedonicus]UUK67267.1 hypothetical protein LRE50_16035 [Clavibacter sepedonicus]CAQ03195.1 putative integral membrane protein [Clavibacter sepedonicus]
MASECDAGPLGCAGQAIGDAVKDTINGDAAIIKGVAGAAKGAADTAHTVISVGSDPLGYLYQKAQDSASSLADTVLSAAAKTTLPDLNADWFTSVYKASFAISITFAMILLMVQIYRTTVGRQGVSDMFDAVGKNFLIFLGGAAFGPSIGVLLVQITAALESSIIEWGTAKLAGQTMAEVIKGVTTSAVPSSIAGNVVVALCLMLAQVLSLFMVLIMQIIQYLMLYFMGALLPLGLMWLIDKNRRTFALKIVGVWFATLIGHPLLIFLFMLVSMFVVSTISSNWFGVEAIQATVNLAAATLATLMVAFVPFMLYKFAPILPQGGLPASSERTPAPGNNRTMDDVRRRMQERQRDPASGPGNTASPAQSAGSPAAGAPKKGVHAASPAAKASQAGDAAKKAAAMSAAKKGAAAVATAGTGGAACAVVAGAKAAKSVQDAAKRTATTAADHVSKHIDDHDEER